MQDLHYIYFCSNFYCIIMCLSKHWLLFKKCYDWLNKFGCLLLHCGISEVKDLSTTAVCLQLLKYNQISRIPFLFNTETYWVFPGRRHPHPEISTWSVCCALWESNAGHWRTATMMRSYWWACHCHNPTLTLQHSLLARGRTGSGPARSIEKTNIWMMQHTSACPGWSRPTAETLSPGCTSSGGLHLCQLSPPDRGCAGCCGSWTSFPLRMWWQH